MSILNLLPSIVFLTVLIFTESSNARKGGITIDLIHRESPLSPFSNPSDTYSTRLSNSVARSRSRANHFHAASSVETNDIQSDVTPDTGAYLMKFSIGTPPVEILAIADTGSDLIWTQCDPCKKCYQQKGPIFNSQQSSTYKVLPCDSSYCQVLPKHRCGQQTRNCVYLYSYGDNYSYTTGVIANETLTFDSSNGQAVSIPNILFGCGKVNVLKGTPNSAGINSAGIVGLGGGPVSLVSQLSSEYGGKFSYCLVPLLDKQATSKLRFGDEAMISGQGVVSTPFISKDSGTFYYLTLEGVSVGNRRLDMQSAAANPGNMIIDSGTTLTYLDSDLYNAVASAVQGAIKVQSVPHPSETFPFCYNINSDLMIPEMTFHFTGADLKVGPSNTFIRATQDLVCITLAPAKSLPIFGNLAQVNFQVEYDRQGKKVSFAAADCTKF